MNKSLLFGLNPAQEKAVVFSGRPLMILAGAGSGKTRVLTHRAAWLVDQGKARPDQLLLLTFTNKAAEEMKTRLLSLLKKKTSPDLFAGTFHSFCALILRKEGKKIEVPPLFVIYDEKDQMTLIENLVKKMNLPEERFKPAMIKSIIESAKNNLIDPQIFLESTHDSWQEPAGLVYREYQKKLKQLKALDFSDLLFFGVELFRKKPEVLEKYQKKYQYVLVDEYQDTNKAQYVLTKLLAGKHRNLTVVGDAAQAIYGWRGADHHNLLSLTKDFPETKVINLEQNYRSTQTILDAANAIIAKNVKHPILKLFTQNDQGEKVFLYRASSEVAEAEFAAEKIKQLVDFQGIDPTKIAVLYRTNAQSRAIEEVFIRQGLPYILIGGVKFYNRAEIKDVLSLIRVFHNPSDEISWQRIEKNFGKRRKEKVKEFIKKNKKRGWKTEELFRKIVSASQYLEKYNPDNEDDYRRLENIKELASVAKQFSKVSQFLENVALVQQEYFAQEKEKARVSGEAVRLMTLHSSKGLEFEAVFVVGLEDGLLPHARSIDDLERLEEERRLCYVGMTRAKKHLFLTYASKRLYFGRSSYSTPSRFLEDLPEKLTIREEGEKNDFWQDDEWDQEW